jgi:anthranilate/para-aminobenzoate synthase component II
MNSQEFYLWLNGYLEALESEGITECKIENIRKKMERVNNRTQERVIFGPGIKSPQQQGYANNPPK